MKTTRIVVLSLLVYAGRLRALLIACCLLACIPGVIPVADSSQVGNWSRSRPLSLPPSVSPPPSLSLSLSLSLCFSLPLPLSPVHAHAHTKQSNQEANRQASMQGALFPFRPGAAQGRCEHLDRCRRGARAGRLCCWGRLAMGAKGCGRVSRMYARDQGLSAAWYFSRSPGPAELHRRPQAQLHLVASAALCDESKVSAEPRPSNVPKRHRL